MKLVPLADRVVLKQLEAETTTKTGIILTGSAQEKPQEAEVIAVGPGTEDVKAYELSYEKFENGVGDSRLAIAREYKEGTLLLEMAGHNTGDDERDMESSDSISAILDSMTFEK